MIKLHLGCGDKHLDGYINIDFYESDATDQLIDINNIEQYYEPNSVDVIYMAHVLEHFERTQAQMLLDKLFEILKPLGILRLAVPDWDAIIERYNETKNLKELLHILYGNHDRPLGGHFTVWSFDSLKADLFCTGFIDAWRYDWRFTDHNTVDDFSRAHLPHDPDAIRTGNFTNHKLMSLNVEALK